MKVLIIGSGGREHALAWKVSQSPRLDALFCAPGNAGTSQLGRNIPVNGEDISGVLQAVKTYEIDLVIVGPEAPLAKGLSDALRREGLRVFAPSQAAAALEYSKDFAKQFMIRHKIPTAGYATFSDFKAAEKYIKEQGAPLVVKADGLAAGKGVIIALNQEEAIQAARDMLEGNAFGEAGCKVVIEEFLEGEEVSILAFCDGKTIVPMVSAQDHKRAYDDDEGPNTGGMGAYSPAPVYTEDLAEIVMREVLLPSCEKMTQEGNPYQGVLYAGLMITEDGPKVLEYNARFGDPETQAVLVRLKSDLLDIIDAVIEEKLDKLEIQWSPEAAVCVVMAAGGYPGSYGSGYEISGIEAAEKKGSLVFHGGTAEKEGKLVSNGGRVLGVTGLGPTIKEAMDNTYAALEEIKFQTAFYRKDIGRRALTKN